eukprot:6484354-Amphidinium_carterae.1
MYAKEHCRHQVDEPRIGKHVKTIAVVVRSTDSNHAISPATAHNAPIGQTELLWRCNSSPDLCEASRETLAPRRAAATSNLDISRQHGWGADNNNLEAEHRRKILDHIALLRTDTEKKRQTQVSMP